MTLLSWIMFGTLTGIAGLHAYWAFGGVWPAKDQAGLVRTVVGLTDASPMPPAGLTLVVAALIFCAAALPVMYLSGGPIPLPDWVFVAGFCILTTVFIGRGAITYILPRMTQDLAEPFRTLNRTVFSPLCLALGLGFFVFAVSVLR